MSNASDYIKPVSEEESSNKAWIMTLADLLSLLLVFFILIYSMTSVKTGEWDIVMDSLGRSFNSNKIVEEVNFSTSLGINREDTKKGLDLNYLHAVLGNKVENDSFLSNNIQLKNTGDSLIISLKNTNLFEGNTPILVEDAQVVLFVIGDGVQRIDNKIEIVGYFDQKKEKDGLLDWELALKRAIVIAGELRKYGNLSRMSSIVRVKPIIEAEGDKVDDKVQLNSIGRVDIFVHEYVKEF